MNHLNQQAETNSTLTKAGTYIIITQDRYLDETYLGPKIIAGQKIIKLFNEKKITPRDFDNITRLETKNQEKETIHLKQATEKINHNKLARQLTIGNDFITFEDTQEILKYNSKTGVYEPSESMLMAMIQEETDYNCTTHLVNETLNTIRRSTYVERDTVGHDTKLIPLQNGVLNLDTMELINYNPDMIFLTKHPVEWKTKEENEMIDVNPIESFIEEVTENQVDEVLLKEITGYTFYRGMPFHNFFLLYGKGSNGKSVYLNMLRAMLGYDNVSNESLQSLVDNRFSQANLYLKNANVFGDLSSKSLTDAGMLKLLTGNDMITAEQKFKPSFQFKNYAKIIASCNEVPETPDTSEGFFRRAVILNFPRSFEGREDRTLIDKLITPENLSNFLFVSLNAFKGALEESKWVRQETVLDKKRKYMNLSNSSYAFCDLCLDYDPELEIKTMEIYSKYKLFCKGNKIVPKDERSFFLRLYKFFNHKVYKRRKEFIGIRQHVICGLVWK